MFGRRGCLECLQQIERDFRYSRTPGQTSWVSVGAWPFLVGKFTLFHWKNHHGTSLHSGSAGMKTFPPYSYIFTTRIHANIYFRWSDLSA